MEQSLHSAVKRIREQRNVSYRLYSLFFIFIMKHSHHMKIMQVSLNIRCFKCKQTSRVLIFFVIMTISLCHKCLLETTNGLKNNLPIERDPSQRLTISLDFKILPDNYAIISRMRTELQSYQCNVSFLFDV